MSEGASLTIRQAAELVGVRRDLLYEAIGRGDLHEVEGLVKRVRLVDVEAWLKCDPAVAGQHHTPPG